MVTHNKSIAWHYVKDFLFILVGVLSACVGLNCFLLPNNFLDGGVTGIALLIELTTDFSLSILLVLLNLPFILLGGKQISWAFAIKGTVGILLLAVLVHFLHFPVLTDDKLLISVFGGFFLGLGTGCAIRGGAVIDGTEVLAISVSRKSSLTVGDFITIVNIALFAVAAFLVSKETAMYSLLTYLSASKTVDFVVNGVEEYIGVTIISNKNIEIKEKIAYELGRGVTAYKGGTGFGKTGVAEQERLILFCVVTRLEVSKLIFEIESIDENAFVIQHPIKDTKGGMIKKRPLH